MYLKYQYAFNNILSLIDKVISVTNIINPIEIPSNVFEKINPQVNKVAGMYSVIYDNTQGTITNNIISGNATGVFNIISNSEVLIQSNQYKLNNISIINTLYNSNTYIDNLQNISASINAFFEDSQQFLKNYGNSLVNLFTNRFTGNAIETSYNTGAFNTDTQTTIWSKKFSNDGGSALGYHWSDKASMVSNNIISISEDESDFKNLSLSVYANGYTLQLINDIETDINIENYKNGIIKINGSSINNINVKNIGKLIINVNKNLTANKNNIYHINSLVLNVNLSGFKENTSSQHIIYNTNIIYTTEDSKLFNTASSFNDIFESVKNITQLTGGFLPSITSVSYTFNSIISLHKFQNNTNDEIFNYEKELYKFNINNKHTCYLSIPEDINDFIPNLLDGIIHNHSHKNLLFQNNSKTKQNSIFKFTKYPTISLEDKNKINEHFLNQYINGINIPVLQSIPIRWYYTIITSKGIGI